MRNKKGFTLIELLAVIVVLAIIALIATPIVMNTIKNSKKGAAERGADNYIKQVETAIATSKLDGKDVADGTYTIESDGNICPLASCGENDKDKITIEMNGEKPKSGFILISNGQVDTSSAMEMGDYTVSYNPTNKKYEAKVVVYRCSEEYVEIGDTINPNDTAKFTKDPATLGKDYYLKHVLDKDNKVIESYACSILKSKEYCVKSVGYDSGMYPNNALILKEIDAAKIEGISCYFSDNGSSCTVNPVSLTAYSTGDVSATGSNGGCDAVSGGNSYCSSY